jgi:preprotein translocase subunit SecA
MFGSLFDSNEKQLKKLKPLVEKINSFSDDFEKLADDELKQKTFNWKELLKDKTIEDQQKILDDILPEAFALVREAGRRTLNMRHYDVQLLAGIELHRGKIAEQKTGEGKTLTATLPLYLNSLTGRGVHLVTPNDYLSRHGAGWMGPVYEALGVTAGVIVEDKAFIFDPQHQGTEFDDAYAVHLREVEKQKAYECDIVYGTNHHFGFDYLRDNMTMRLADMVQTNPNGEFGVHNYAIVDEVDSILIDVARTPLIISTRDSKPSDRYQEANRIMKSLAKDSDYEVDEKFRTATLTDLGVRRVERLLGAKNLYEDDFEMVHLIEQALIALALYEKDKDYVVKDGKVVIVDQFTGRILPSNRFSHGLHQAIESKENVQIQDESKTLAEVSYQNYFRMYSKLAGMTGTAATEAEEFYKIYKLEVVVVPTNKEVVREDRNDMVYKTESAKFKAVADEIGDRYQKGQPVLVGTTSVEKSQILHNYLDRKKIPHEILNAKNHDREALIIAQAGKKHSVTISTNMAGRGVDIKLGGDPQDEQEMKEVLELGGLHVIGTERHESRRIDNQLRGRSGRQGEAGSSRFFVSLQDDLMRIFGGDRLKGYMDKFGLDDNVPLEAGLVSKSIESAQKKVEGFNFDSRKRVVEQDDVMNVHREVVYKLRRKILEFKENDGANEEWISERLSGNTDFTVDNWEDRKKQFGMELWRQIVSDFGLPVVDMLWMDHLVDMEQLRTGIGLRGYAQRDPMVEYKKEGHERFEILVKRIYTDLADRLLKISADTRPHKRESSVLEQMARNASYQFSELESGVSDETASLEKPVFRDDMGREVKVEKVKSNEEKPGRNDPCWCGSGKKYKKCHYPN